MRRIMYLWLPRWPIDRRRLSPRKNIGAPAEEAPFATVADAAGRRLLAAVNPAATAAGLAPGMPLADALSFLPRLATTLAKPAEDAAALRRLAEWCVRYSPWTAPDGADGAGKEHSLPIWRPGSTAGVSPAASSLPIRSALRGRWPALRKRATASSFWLRESFAPPSLRCRWKPSVSTRSPPKGCGGLD